MFKRATLIAAIFMLASLAAASSAAAAIQGMAVVFEVKGDVQVQSGKAEWVAATDGMLLRKGDKIKTGPDSSCAIKWSASNIMRLQPFSAVVIQKLDKDPASNSENSSIGLWSGRAYVKAKKLSGPGSSFDIKTPNSVAGIRGTVMSVGVIDQKTTGVECFEGSVAVRGMTGGAVTISSGQKTLIVGDSPPSAPVKLQTSDEIGFEDITQSSEPTLEIIQPVGDLETGESPIAVKGKTDPGATVSVNGAQAQADSSGNFTASVSLEPGVNHIKIASANKKGITTTKTRVIKYTPGAKAPLTLETGSQSVTSTANTTSSASAANNASSNGDNSASLNLTISGPAGGLVTREANVTVSGVASVGAKVSVNNIPAAVSPGSGAFNLSLPLVEGENQIEIKAEKGGRERSETRLVTKDTTPPRLIITSPAGGVFEPGAGGCSASGDNVYCSIIGQTEFGVSLLLNGNQCAVSADGSFECSVTLSSGVSTIEISAQDRAGNRSVQVLSRAYDRTKLSRIQITLSPSAIVADMQSTSQITVNAYNFLGEPVQATILLTTTTGGTVSPSTVTTNASGYGSSVFTAGAGSILNIVTITAASGAYSASASLILTPDIPPVPGQ